MRITSDWGIKSDGKACKTELLEMLPHKWNLNHPEAVITKEEK